MKINKISLYNFNSFEGLNEFDFSVEDNGKNIILIGGKNGAGKTSLFTAIKIGLYGPLAFGYVGINSYYIAKIKDCINSKAFQTKKVESRVQITIAIMVEREIKEYEITREWDYSSQKLIENYYVRCEGQQLTGQELSYFQNYLQSLIPPDLFEFFLFDGEAVGSIFSTSSYNSYVKNAIYMLCGLDTYELIRKFTRGYAGKAATEDEVQVRKEYEKLKEEVEQTEAIKDRLDAEIETGQEELELLEMDLIEMETAFKNAGGITQEEREELLKGLEKSERLKSESAAKIKNFVEGVMPFFIVREFSEKIADQLDYEEQCEIFSYVQWKLDRDEIHHMLGDNVSDSMIDELMDMLLAKFEPKGFSEDSKPMYDLSKEDTAIVNAMISKLNDFSADDMVKTVKQKQKAADRTMEINKILRSAMTDEDAAAFAERHRDILKKKNELNQKTGDARVKLEHTIKQLETLIQQKERAWQRVKDNAQNQHVVELSSGLSKMMSSLLSSKMVEIREKLESLIVENLQCIYRKNNLITHIEIDDNFQFNLYQDALYTAEELANLMENLGKQSFAVMIGKQSMELLLERFGVNTLDMLQKLLMFNPGYTFKLYQNIDLSRLSRGERQIFILSFYWSIIKLSGKDIPFVIDTPYARIDANHRKEISEKFFPNISKQVVILSTDEEINEEYYQTIKPYIAREYLLINDENQNRTSVENHYFFEA